MFLLLRLIMRAFLERDNDVVCGYHTGETKESPDGTTIRRPTQRLTQRRINADCIFRLLNLGAVYHNVEPVVTSLRQVEGKRGGNKDDRSTSLNAAGSIAERNLSYGRQEEHAE